MRDAIRSTFWEVTARLDAGESRAATEYVLSLHPADQADVLAALSREERRRIFEQMTPAAVAEVIENLTPRELELLTPQLETAHLAAALSQADAGTAADVLHHLQYEQAAAVLAAMGDPSDVEPLLAHEDESAGGIMSPHIITLRPDLTAENTIDYLRAIQPRSGDPYYLYVVDRERHLLGVVSLRDLVIARPQTTLQRLMNAELISTTTDTDQEQVLRTLQHYGLRALPVIDAGGRLVGVATADDLLDVAEQEATEDMFRMVGLDEDESLSAPIRSSVRRRLPWLALNLATAFAAAGVVALFEDTLARVAALAIFLPIVAGQGGNAGTQTLTLVVRAMALGELGPGRWRTAVPREAVIGLANGLALALVVGGLVWLWQDNGWLGLAIGLAVAGNMVVAGLAGALIPFALRALKADPALASGIFVTTVTDVMGFFFFLGLAALMIERID